MGAWNQNHCWPGCNLSSKGASTWTTWPSGLSLLEPSQAAQFSLFIISRNALQQSHCFPPKGEKSVPCAQNPDLPICSSERGETLWTHVLPLSSGTVTAEDASRLNYGSMQASQSESVEERNWKRPTAPEAGREGRTVTGKPGGAPEPRPFPE